MKKWEERGAVTCSVLYASITRTNEMLCVLRVMGAMLLRLRHPAAFSLITHSSNLSQRSRRRASTLPFHYHTHPYPYYYNTGISSLHLLHLPAKPPPSPPTTHGQAFTHHLPSLPHTHMHTRTTASLAPPPAECVFTLFKPCSHTHTEPLPPTISKVVLVGVVALVEHPHTYCW